MTPIALLRAVFAVAAGYLLGSISFAVVISKLLAGTDIRATGSGNAGTTNMLRTYGWLAAGLTFAGDLAKGAVAVLVGRALMGPELGLYGAYLGGIGALIGHMKPLFFGFKGGKGVATGLGVLLCADPIVFAAISLIGFPMAFATGYVSLASITCAGAFPLFLAVFRFVQGRFNGLELVLAALLGWGIVYNHRENWRRLRAGTERRFGHHGAVRPPDKEDQGGTTHG